MVFTEIPVAADRLLISIATYNERENLAELISAIFTQVPSAHVLVVDDASPDGTGQIADDLAKQDQRILTMHRTGKLGLGSAIIAGMRFAIQNGYQRFVSMDADGSHDPRYLPALVALGTQCQVMIGSRYVPGGGVENWPWKRYLISRCVNLFTRLFLGIPARDASGGFRCYRTALLKKIDFDRFWSKGYSFQEEMLFRCMKMGARIKETPIVFADRKVGGSKANMKEMVRSLGVLCQLGFSAIFWPTSFSKP